MREEVLVTGCGFVSPLGSDYQTLWTNLKAGKSGVRQIDVIDGSRVSMAAKVQEYHLELDEKEARKYDPFIQYAFQATKNAIADAVLDPEMLASPRVAAVISSGIGGLQTIQDNHNKLKVSPRRVSPFFIPGTIINLATGLIATHYGIQGPSFSPVSACASSAHSIAIAAMLIETGQADIVIAGGAEYASTDLSIAGFAALRALSTRNDEPEAASRPWDKARDGFVIGDGAAVLILESKAHADKRQARALGQLVGYGMTSDGYHITSPDPEGDGAKRAMDNALRHAGVMPVDVGYINAHATSTPLGDLAELSAINKVFADAKKDLKISSTKSMHGHLLGAAGAFEAIISLMVMRHGWVVPTINLHEPEDDYGFDLVALQAQQHDVQIAMSNSFGFGGTNVSLVFAKT